MPNIKENEIIWSSPDITPAEIRQLGKFENNEVHNLCDVLTHFHGLSFKDVDLIDHEGGTIVVKKS